MSLRVVGYLDTLWVGAREGDVGLEMWDAELESHRLGISTQALSEPEVVVSATWRGGGPL